MGNSEVVSGQANDYYMNRNSRNNTYCTRCDHYRDDYLYSPEVFSDSAAIECECVCHS